MGESWRRVHNVHRICQIGICENHKIRRKAVQNSRSSGFNRGRGCFRLSTATCCRRRHDCQRGVTPIPEEYPDCRQEDCDEFEHALHLVTLCAQGTIGRGRKSLISARYKVLTTNNGSGQADNR
jgi:hypothetical protein